MTLTLEQLETTLIDYDGWKSGKANATSQDLSVRAYLEEVKRARAVDLLLDIRVIIDDEDASADRMVDQIGNLLASY